MTKTNKTIVIDVDLSKKLESINASGLINRLLRDYFEENKNNSLEKVRGEIKIKKELIIKNKEEIKVLKGKAEKIQKRDKLIKDIYKNIPDEVLEDFRFFKKMNLDILRSRHKNIYSKKYKVSWEEIKKAFHRFKSGGKKDETG